MNFKEFSKKARSVRFPRYVQFTSQFSSIKQVGCDYYIYVCLDTLEIINPFTKKHKDRNYKSFQSSVSADDAKTKAFEYIKEFLT